MAKSVDAADLKSASPRECGFKSRRPHPLRSAAWAVLASATLSACEASPPDALDVTVIGPRPTAAGRDAPSAVLNRATSQGLVRLDEAGVVTPGLAERWIVLDDGLTVIVRLAGGDWADGRPVRSAEVRDALRRVLARPGESATVRAVAAAVSRVNAVIPSILEIKLAAQRPDLLALLAQPEFALRLGGGSGPRRAAAPDAAGWWALEPPSPDSEEVEGDEVEERALRLRGEAAATALARYGANGADVVLGGRLGDLPLAASASDAPLVDPTEGLFGLRIARREGFVADAEGRHALAMALDRPSLVATFGVVGWTPAATLVSGPSPVPFDWSAGNPAQRLRLARERVARWRAGHGDIEAAVRVATADGPGGRLLLAWLTRQWAAIGVRLVEVGAGDAQLDWIDAVAPSSDPAATLELIRCGRSTPCGDEATEALARLGGQPTLAGWRRAEREAEAALVADLPVIPLARPLRWSVVRPGVPGVVANPRAIHPLTRMVPTASPGP